MLVQLNLETIVIKVASTVPSTDRINADIVNLYLAKTTTTISAQSIPIIATLRSISRAISTNLRLTLSSNINKISSRATFAVCQI